MSDFGMYGEGDSWAYCEKCRKNTPHKTKPGGGSQCLSCLYKKARHFGASAGGAMTEDWDKD